MFNIRHLQTFVTIADCGSFAIAADRLGLTQSAVSMQIKTLESEFRQPLFDRSRRSPLMNDMGESLLPTMREIIRMSDELRSMAGQVDELSGKLYLGVISSVSTGILPEAIMMMKQEYPRLVVRIENGQSAELIRQVSDGKLDAAIVTEPDRLSPDIRCRTIVEEPIMIVAPATCAGSSELALFKDLPFICFNRRTGTGRIIENQLRKRKVKVNVTMELDSIESILEMVAQGVGVSIVPEHCVTARYLEDLYILPFGEPMATRRIGFIERNRHHKELFTDALFDKLQLSEITRQHPLGDALQRRSTQGKSEA
ncbi:MAG: DNA-binding transcriptional LysR family regulator [Gammaproteobacteria bacterium]|jgi:DNA-binding transcriptional LysR family regulator